MGWWVWEEVVWVEDDGNHDLKIGFLNAVRSWRLLAMSQHMAWIFWWTKKIRYLCSIRVEVSGSKDLWRLRCAISKSWVKSRQSLCSIFPPLHDWCWKSTLFHIWWSQDHWENLWLFTSCKCVQRPKFATWPTSWLVVGRLCHFPYLVKILGFST